MIEEQLITFQTKRLYDENSNQINPESLAFVLESGQELMKVYNKELTFVPGDGVNGQILKKGDGYVYWDDLTSVKSGVAVNNLGMLYSVNILKLSASTADTTQEVKFLGSFVKGQEITLYITKDETAEYAPTITLDNSIYISLKGEYSFKIEDNLWLKLHFISDGEKIYVDSAGATNLQFIEGSTNDGTTYANSIMHNNGTTQAKNQYEFSIGKYNASSRETSGKFGVDNTIFTVGNGLDENNRHSALKVYQNGKVTISDLNSEGEYYEKKEIVINDKLLPVGGQVGQVLQMTENGPAWVDLE